MPRHRYRSVSGGSFHDMENSKNTDASLFEVPSTLLEAVMQRRDASGRTVLHSNHLKLTDTVLQRCLALDAERGDTKQRLSMQAVKMTDLESGYTGLHWAVYQRDVASILQWLSFGRSTLERPMLLLHAKSGAKSMSPLQQALVSAVDADGQTAGDLLADLQRTGLRECRKALPQPTVKIQNNSRRRSRGGSFDVIGDDGDLQDELAPLSHQLQQLHDLQQHQAAVSRTPVDDTRTTYACEVVTFGSAHHCALGVVAGEGQDNHSKNRPQRVVAFGQDTVGRAGGAVACAAATHHTLVVTADGKLYAFGLGKGGRLGIGTEAHCPMPTRVAGPLSNRKVVAVAAAENHSLAVTDQGVVFSWGSNRFGQLGTSDTNTRCVPRRVDDLKSVVCAGVAAGERHSVALSNRGEVYVWGDNTSGQLGISRRNGIHKVQRVEALWNSSPSKQAISVAASEQATLVLTLPVGSGLPVHSIYSWGHGSHAPSKLNFVSERTVNPIAIACARFHNVAITADGMVYSWGLHNEPLGTTKKSPSVIPQLVTGMLPENGGGTAVAVSASENHTAVLTDTGALYTWGATHGKNILGHEGVRWQPDPKRVPGVHRAVGVVAAKEHTVLLIGACFPPMPQANMTLESMAARKVAQHVDLFNVFPILIMAERTHCSLLKDYCMEFVQRNLDGVLTVGQKSAMYRYLNEQLLTSMFETECDGRYHPLILEILTAGKDDRSAAERAETMSSTESWLEACSALSTTPGVAGFVKAVKTIRTTRAKSFCEPKVSHSSSCSARCLELTKNVLDSVSSKEQAEAKVIILTKEVRGVRKRLTQIAKLKDTSSELTPEQKEKLARRPQLESDLKQFEPALEKLEKYLRDLVLAESPAVQITVKEESEEKTTPEKDETSPPQPKSSASFRCEVCQVPCPDQRSFDLHMNGRKHRNRVAQVQEDEAKNAAQSMQDGQRRQEMLSGRPSLPTTPKALNPWQKEKSSVQPKYKLPPPPHPVADKVILPGPATGASPMSLADIMKEEARTSTKPKIKAKPKPGLLSLPAGSPPPLQSPPWAKPSTTPRAVAKSSPALTLPAGAVPSLASPPWASATRVDVAPSKGGAYSLGDFMRAPPQTSPAVRTAEPVWSSPLKASPASASSVSFSAIQQEEQDFQSKRDMASGSDGAWFIQQRERAGSFKEIQDITAKQEEERRLVQEQLWIEKQIEQQLAEKKSKQAKQQGKKKQNSNKKPRNPSKNNKAKPSNNQSDSTQKPKPRPRSKSGSAASTATPPVSASC